MRWAGPGSSRRRARVRAACSPSPRRRRPPPRRCLPAPRLSCPHLGSCPPSSWHPARARPCRGRGTRSRRPLRCCPQSPGSSLCSGSRCRRGEGTTGGCGRRCLGPSGGRPPGHICAYDGQQLLRATALIVGHLSQCQGDKHRDHQEHCKGGGRGEEGGGKEKKHQHHHWNRASCL